MRTFIKKICSFGFIGLGLLGSMTACHPKATPTAALKSENLGSEMPESLRCKQSSDCVVQTTCYWSEATCVAASSMVAPKCEDADPQQASRADVTCGCSAGQCVVN
ncbi:MAG TPA: hypothetical protein VGB85_33690 [Nannocystis sp.]